MISKAPIVDHSGQKPDVREAGARFSKVPVTYGALKAILEVMIHLMWKAVLLICFRWKERQNNCQVSNLETSSYWTYKGICVTQKVSGRSRTGPWLLLLKKTKTSKVKCIESSAVTRVLIFWSLWYHQNILIISKYPTTSACLKFCNVVSRMWQFFATHGQTTALRTRFFPGKWPSVLFFFECIWKDQVNRELKQPRRRRQQNPHKFAYLTMKNSIFARFARGFFIFSHFADVLVLSTTWNDLFCSCVDDVQHMMTNVQFCLLMSQALNPIYFQDI